MTVHDLIDDIEKEITQQYHCTVVIHMDPVISGDIETEYLKSKVRLFLSQLGPELTFHDFRLVHHDSGEKRVSFDVQVPYKYDLKDDLIIDYLTEHLKGVVPDLTLDIDVDKTLDEEE